MQGAARVAELWAACRSLVSWHADVRPGLPQGPFSSDTGGSAGAVPRAESVVVAAQPGFRPCGAGVSSSWRPPRS